MNEELFEELVKAGIDKKTAHKVAASLNPDHLATKEDLLRLEKVILEFQQKTDARFLSQQTEMTKELAAIQASTSDKLAASNRQFLVTFLGLGLTACVLFTLNLYFH
ncbi:hypothetical protein [Endozoicomonas sp. ONNA2]|uniref:hypothetical protein n=1 Tax=Endozoicomonas sp. ONNA2 TaxID=2828741 RepID=UPI002148783F|nr:hypothetical protein [Endozoicomonas sp. ONNA2]